VFDRRAGPVEEARQAFEQREPGPAEADDDETPKRVPAAVGVVLLRSAVVGERLLR
jgi:hypothetical protein